MAAINSYKDLLVWQRAISYVDQVYILTKKLPTEERYCLSNQMTRAAISIPTNIAEGWGRESLKNYIQFLRTARGSVFESETLLIIAKNQNYLSTEEFERLSTDLIEISKMLNSLIKKLEIKLVQRIP